MERKAERKHVLRTVTWKGNYETTMTKLEGDEM